MKKIPTVFVRDPEDLRRVLPEVHPDCQWVLDGEGIATRKYDGTCVMLSGTGVWWARREVKPRKEIPPGYVIVQHDEATGKLVGWEPMAQSSFAKFLWEAIGNCPDLARLKPGTYELVGPKVNGNPERLEAHELISHELAEVSLDDRDHDLRSFEAIRDLVLGLAINGWEGLVYHHPDGCMAKVKARDFQAEER